MARSRGEANEALYRARILLSAWDTARAEGRWPEHQLLAAYLPAVRLHLRSAYGWFLLAVSGEEEAAVSEPPATVAQLPEPPAGRERPPELAEFARLEHVGWLADMLAVETARPAPMVAGNNLLGSDRETPGFAVASRWAQSLADTMQRMDDSLNEC